MPVPIISRSTTEWEKVTEETTQENDVQRYDEFGLHPTWKMDHGMNLHHLAV